MLERDNTSEYCHVLKWIFREYDAYKVLQVNHDNSIVRFFE